MAYYVTSEEWTGPRSDTDTPDKRGVLYYIADRPSRGNSGSHPEIINGWLGTTNDWHRAAHGEFETLEAAREKIVELGGLLRPPDTNWETEEIGLPEGSEESGVVEVYGDHDRYTQMTEEYWVAEGGDPAEVAAAAGR